MGDGGDWASGDAFAGPPACGVRGTMRELENEPRVAAGEAIRQAREEVCGTHSGRTLKNVDDRK